MNSDAEQNRLAGLIEGWSTVALESGWVDDWRDGAIYPRELVFFLARCEAGQIRTVVESGRQDGYSTAILAAAAERLDARVVSIDFEEDAERAARCRARLLPFSRLRLLKGNANVLLDRVVIAEQGGPVAVLVDGPKGFWAMSLMFAVARHEWVHVLALHNLEEGERERDYFKSRSTQPLFYEDLALADCPAWRRLGDLEMEASAKRLGQQSRRSAQRSSLGVMRIGPTERRRLPRSVDRGFVLFQPPLVRLGWNAGLHSLTHHLFGLSFRLPWYR